MLGCHTRSYKKKASCQGHLMAPLIKLVSVYALGYSVRFAYLLSVIYSRDRSPPWLWSFNQGTDMCFYCSVGPVESLFVYAVNMKMEQEHCL